MPDATEQHTVLPTDIGPVREKLFRGVTGVTRIDVNDFDQVFALVMELHRAPRRRLFQVTFGEWRAIARMALISAPILTRVFALIDETDRADASTEEHKARTRAALEDVITLARTARAALNGGDNA